MYLLIVFFFVLIVLFFVISGILFIILGVSFSGKLIFVNWFVSKYLCFWICRMNDFVDCLGGLFNKV